MDAALKARALVAASPETRAVDQAPARACGLGEAQHPLGALQSLQLSGSAISCLDSDGLARVGASAAGAYDLTIVKHGSKRRCKASNKRGEPCQATIVDADGYCPAHAAGGRDMRKLGKLGGQARGRRRKETEEETQADRLTRAAWKALEELLASDVAPTAKVRAVGETLDRLEPLIGRTSRAAAVAQAKGELADEWHAATLSAREKLRPLLATRAPGVRAPGGKRAVSEEWAVAVGQGAG